MGSAAFAIVMVPVAVGAAELGKLAAGAGLGFDPVTAVSAVALVAVGTVARARGIRRRAETEPTER